MAHKIVMIMVEMVAKTFQKAKVTEICFARAYMTCKKIYSWFNG